MRASKEQACLAKQNLETLRELFLATRSPKAHEALEQLGEFLDAARRKLPTEGAYDRDSARWRFSGCTE